LITRIFHPIGQGAFYSEKHETDSSNVFTIVYDCGCSSDKDNLKDTMIKRTFNKNQKIDILFISHFDLDHVSKIPVLNEHTQIERVVMPLLHEEEKILLGNFYRGMGKTEITKLVESPESFFGEQTSIIKVKSANGFSLNVENSATIGIEEISQSRTIESGTRLKLGFSNWIFIPYNYEYEERHLKLVEKLNEAGIDSDKLSKDKDYAIDEIYKSIGASKRRKVLDPIKTLNNIYKTLEGGINQNSMLVYSGPNTRNSSRPHEWWRQRVFWQYCCCRNYFLDNCRVACIYTGDANLKKEKVEKIYADLWENVGTIQVPHHGSCGSFNGSFLNEGIYLCPISFGEENRYDHPASAVVAEIVKKGSIPVYVTDRGNTVMIEIID